MIALCDLGLENLKRLQRMFERLGYMAIITNDPEEILCCDCIVISGVGNPGDGFKALKKNKMDKLIVSMAKKGKQIIGVGLGASLLCRSLQDNGWYKGLDLLPLEIVEGKRADGFLPTSGRGALAGVNGAFYYCQSGFVRQGSGDANAEDNGEFISAKIHKNVAALWFYPHKSGEQGLEVMQSILKISEKNGVRL